MYDKILVPLDGSLLAEVSLPYAEEIAARLGSQITLIYLSRSEKDPAYHMHEMYLDKILDSTANEINKLLKKPSEKAKIESSYPDGSREYFVKDNKAYYSLIPAYTNDGGHLNETGRKIVASELIRFLASLSE